MELFSGDATIVEKFIKNGGDVNEVNKFGMTPLHVAVQEIQPKIIEILIRGGAHMNHRDNRRRTPLDINAQYGINCNLFFFFYRFFPSNDKCDKNPRQRKYHGDFARKWSN